VALRHISRMSRNRLSMTEIHRSKTDYYQAIGG